MSAPCFLAPEVLLRRVDDRWVASNPCTREHVGLDSVAIAVLGRHAGGALPGLWIQDLGQAGGWDCTALSIDKGLWADSSGLAETPAARTQAGNELFQLLRRRHILVQSPAETKEFVAPLASVLDRSHLGTFHQRVGQHLTLVKRQPEKWRWWYGQKFSEDGQSVLSGPYRDVQEHFFDSRFADGSLNGRRVLDFGCGNGFYSRKLEALGAIVTGLDSSEELLDLAASKAGANARFIRCPTPEDTMAALRAMPAASFDIVYLSDTFLLLAENPTDLAPLAPLLDEFARLLGPGGRMHLFEPNPIYWLAAYYGATSSPYAVVTEHRLPVFNVAPPLDRVIGAMAASGFALVEYCHPGVRSGSDVDPALRARADSFPLWDFMTFIVR